jgi:hypothetical protein
MITGLYDGKAGGKVSKEGLKVRLKSWYEKCLVWTTSSGLLIPHEGQPNLPSSVISFCYGEKAYE